MHLTILTEPKGYSPKAIAALRKLGPVAAWREARQKPAALKSATILAVKLGMKISKRVMDQLPNLKVIGTSTTGLNHIDMAEAERRGIAVVSLRGETEFLRTIFPTAEETMGLMIMLMRNLHLGYRGILAEEWWKERSYGHELAGKTLGVIGFGRLGSIVTRYATTLGMKVLASDPNVSEADIEAGGAKKVSQEELLKNADIVSLHVLHTPELNDMIGRNEFRMMKPTAYYINTARGELNDEAALLEALAGGWIAGAALDVLANEDPTGAFLKGHPLVAYAKDHPNLLIVPHLGGATFESMAKTEDFIAEKIARALSGE
ncbi:MAG: hypothetical protein A3A44_01385 [Candidatus Sungbacteria bacterium RIFCSPLOWO2_01_FULL_60_25]|uniref:Hydroxyacid dehydrogenase n=1 Tax=Candidatus Sungbacteria bacterium RIFCSPLOWO2_01_FULL_60_25 TaxID=1802281 RepID=A0A1G2LES8_9BACT|nr:MAG: hypothetical protein A3A44_01385 [Candidatus Sungbacteria bacterium RIFCSPLOWO2_01_FULL_60_25]